MRARAEGQPLQDVLLEQGLLTEAQCAELIDARDDYLRRQEAVPEAGTAADVDATVVSPGAADAGLTGPTLEVGGTAGLDATMEQDLTPGTLDADGVTIDEYVPATGADAEITYGDDDVDDGGVGELEGQVVGGCRIGRKLGQGGMGAVYQAEHLALGKKVAIKVIASAAGPTNVMVQRFQREARAAAKLSHPNVVAVYDVGHDQGFHFIQMEFIEGKSVRDLIAEEALDLEESIRILRESLQGLHSAHEQDLVHRDIKPDNILVSHKGEVKIADFGLARQVEEESMEITRSGQILGTPHFMSPEQCDGAKTDARTDLYSLGVTMYTMLAGEKPFVGDTAMAILMKHMNEEPPPLRDAAPDVPEDLDNIVMKMMSKSLDDRYQSAQAVLDDLDLWDRGGKVSAPVRRRRRKSGSGLLVAVLLLLLGGAGGAVAFVQGWIPGLQPSGPAPGPGPSPVVQRETPLELGKQALKRKDYAEAIRLLSEWTASHAGDGEAQAALAKARFEDAKKTGRELLLDRKYDQAIETLRRALTFTKSETDRAAVQADIDRAEKAKGATEATATLERLKQEAHKHTNDGAWEKAVQAWDRVLNANPNDMVAQTMKRSAARFAEAAATIAGATGKVDGAERLLTEQADSEGAGPLLSDARSILEGLASTVQDQKKLEEERTGALARVQRLEALAQYLSIKRAAEAAEQGSRWIDAAGQYLAAADQAPDPASKTAMETKATECRYKQAAILQAQADELLQQDKVSAALAKYRQVLELRPDPVLAKRVQEVAERDATPEGFLYVPAGDYAAGSPDSRDKNPEQPLARLASYYIAQFEVTNAQYGEFVSAGGYGKQELWPAAGWALVGTFVDQTGKPGPATWADGAAPSGRPDHPVIGVSWYEAAAYARWRGRRLPTEIEWERAAAFDPGLNRKRLYPWGNDWREGFAALAGRFDQTHPVGSHPRDQSPAGCFDVAGNAHEWTQSTFDRDGKTFAVARGGGVGSANPESFGRLLRRRVTPLPQYRDGALGFRLAGTPVRAPAGEKEGK